MDPKFAVDLRNYVAVPVECPDCHVHYQLRLQFDHSALFQKQQDRILIRCPGCSKAKRAFKHDTE
jgi:hypothetical protein